LDEALEPTYNGKQIYATVRYVYMTRIKVDGGIMEYILYTTVDRNNMCSRPTYIQVI
jgi:hypothetical protein